MDQVEAYESIRDRLMGFVDHANFNHGGESEARRFNNLVAEAEQLSDSDFSAYKITDDDMYSMYGRPDVREIRYGRLEGQAKAFSRLWDRQAAKFRPPAPRTSIVSERSQILSTLIAAYYNDPARSSFGIVAGNFVHPGLRDPSFKPPLSHIIAMGKEDLLQVRTDRNGNYVVDIPTPVLAAVERGEAYLLDSEAGRLTGEKLAATQTINNITVSGGQMNFASQSSDFTQSQSTSAYSLDELLTLLRELGLTEQGLDEVQQVLAEPQGEGRIARARALASRIIADASGELLAMSAYASGPTISHHLIQAAQFFT